MKINYKNYTIEDFAQDSYFQKWVRNPDQECEEFWSDWLSDNSNRIFEIDEAAELVRSLSFKESNIAEENIIRLWGNISMNINNENRISHYRKNKKSYSTLLKVAASLIPLFILGYLFYSNLGQDEEMLELSNQVSIMKKENPNGKKSQFTLPDGTRVFLNSNSRLLYSSQFNEEIIRKVKLKGEAFFMVKRDTLRPFIIESGDLQTQVLGTAFNVRAFDDEDNIFVAVEEGKVRLQNKRKDENADFLILEQRDLGVFKKKNQSLKREKLEGSEVFDWRNGVIHFQKANFKEIRQTLEQWYGVSFVIKRNIDSKKDFTGSYANKPLRTVLDGLQFVYDFDYSIKNKTITIN
ncbi:FecR domain-containing protein [Reichenbachiella sp. MALMAid0571]|uniref:FecR family protein n=1 Tax=Reichenbachiella sp. MALMAid0571 TaxID=3143939 RepID=UPI0032DE9125